MQRVTTREGTPRSASLLEPEAAFRPGFRFSRLDAVVLVCGGVGAFAVARVSIEFAWLAVVAVLHFFLFCNVFRVSRALELSWSASFLACVGIRALADVPWSVLGGAILAATVLVVWKQALAKSYHGILWRRLNPELPARWASQAGGGRPTEARGSGGGPMPRRVRQNAAGDFYVAEGECLLCLLPSATAPALMGFHDAPEGQASTCFFARQPETEAEVADAVRAISHSCCGALRYGGRDPRVLVQLETLGLTDQCDYPR